MSDRDARVKATKRRIRELAAAGLHCAAIARALGIDRQLVAYHARTAGIEMPEGRGRGFEPIGEIAKRLVAQVQK
jgi:transposase-like protein